jgi:transposase
VEALVEKKPTYDELAFKVELLEAELANLRRLIFGQKRERFVPDQDIKQLAFFYNEPLKKSKPQTETINYIRRKRQSDQRPHGRNPIPAHLPRKEIVIQPEIDVTGLRRIGQEVTEELEYKPGQFYVNRYIRPKYALPNDEGVVIGSLPSRIIEKGIAGPGLVTQILISKYIDHLPLYRQIQQFKRIDVEIAKSTVCGFVKTGCDLLVPLYQLYKEQTIGVNYLMVDETPIRVLDPEKPGTTHQGYYWVYYDPIGKSILFDYQKSRSREGPVDILKKFQGHLQTDGYTAYDAITRKDGVTGLGCMAHARRNFHEALESDKERSEWILSTIQQLYQIEKHAREKRLSFTERYQLRQNEAVPVLEIIYQWLKKESVLVLPRSTIGKAIGYMLNQWPKLIVYATDGLLELDNNLVENAIRPVALGRKNYLFAGSHEGAARAAIIYTFAANAKLHNIEPFTYLRDVLARISDYPFKHLGDLLANRYTHTREHELLRTI